MIELTILELVLILISVAIAGALVTIGVIVNMPDAPDTDESKRIEELERQLKDALDTNQAYQDQVRHYSVEYYDKQMYCVGLLAEKQKIEDEHKELETKYADLEQKYAALCGRAKQWLNALYGTRACGPNCRCQCAEAACIFQREALKNEKTHSN